MRIYNVELTVLGHVTTSKQISFTADKELNLGSVFQSEVSIKPVPNGLRVSATVHTADQDMAYKVASLFIGKMLDVLSIRLNTPLVVSTADVRTSTDKPIAKAVVTEDEFRICFRISRHLNLNQTAFSRALNWYRKGLYTEDPFDKFLALWNAISVVAGRYHNVNPRTQRGIINQIWDCFETLWTGNTANWTYINGNSEWINQNNSIRNNIAHGLVPVEIEHVEDVIGRVENVRRVAERFLIGWSASQLNTDLMQTTN